MGFFASSGILNRRGFFSAPAAAEAPPPPPPPSGIPVAGTNEIVVISSNAFIPSGTWSLNGARMEDITGDRYLVFDGISTWEFYDNFIPIAAATGSADYYPFSGYAIIDGGGSITITAA